MQNDDWISCCCTSSTGWLFISSKWLCKFSFFRNFLLLMQQLNLLLDPDALLVRLQTSELSFFYLHKIWSGHLQIYLNNDYLLFHCKKHATPLKPLIVSGSSSMQEKLCTHVVNQLPGGIYWEPEDPSVRKILSELSESLLGLNDYLTSSIPKSFPYNLFSDTKTWCSCSNTISGCFEAIAQKLHDLGFEGRMAVQCRKKIKKLKGDYRKIKGHNNKSGRNRKTWSSLTPGHRPATEPPVVLQSTRQTLKMIQTNPQKKTLPGNVYSDLGWSYLEHLYVSCSSI